MPALAEFEPIYAAVQRPPTTDPAAAAQEVLVPADPAPAVTGDRPPLTLVGTIGQSLAMLRNDRGEVELKAVGETVAGATVTSIQTSRVEVQHNGRSIVLEKPRDPNAGS